MTANVCPTPTRQLSSPSNAANTIAICRFLRLWSQEQEEKNVHIFLKYNVRGMNIFSGQMCLFSVCQGVFLCDRCKRKAGIRFYFHAAIPQKEVFITGPELDENTAVMGSNRLPALYMKI